MGIDGGKWIKVGYHIPICLGNLVDGTARAWNEYVSVPECSMEHRLPAPKTVPAVAACIGVGLRFPIGSEIPCLHECAVFPRKGSLVPDFGVPIVGSARIWLS